MRPFRRSALALVWIQSSCPWSIARTIVTDPDRTIEPVEDVKERVAESKDFIATTTEDLKQYHRWLKDYLVSEKRNRDRHMRRLRPHHLDNVDVSHISSSNRPVSIVRVLLIGGVLVATGFVWEHVYETIPLETSRGQRGSEQTVLEPKLSHDTDAQRLQPSAPQALMEQKAAAQPAELKPIAGAELVTETLRPNERTWENAQDHESRGNAPFTSSPRPGRNTPQPTLQTYRPNRRRNTALLQTYRPNRRRNTALLQTYRRKPLYLSRNCLQSPRFRLRFPCSLPSLLPRR